MLEHKLLHSSGYDGEQLVDKLFPFILRYSRLDSQPLPDLLAAVDRIGIGFGGLSLLLELFLLVMGFAG